MDDYEPWINFVQRISAEHAIEANARAPIVRGKYMKMEEAQAMASDAVFIALRDCGKPLPIDNTERVRNVTTLVGALLASGDGVRGAVQTGMKVAADIDAAVAQLGQTDTTATPGTDSPAKGEAAKPPTPEVVRLRRVLMLADELLDTEGITATRSVSRALRQAITAADKDWKLQNGPK